MHDPIPSSNWAQEERNERTDHENEVSAIDILWKISVVLDTA